MNKKLICNKISNAALKALLYEVSISPKPGLVDRFNNGSHTDMDMFTFLDSSVALNSYFYDCAELTLDNPNISYDNLFKLLRKRGVQADKDMLNSTNNINTHKGAVFSIGLLASAAALSYRNYREFNSDKIFFETREIYRHSFLKDFDNIDYNNNTNGENIYIKYGIKGVRGEAATGFPTIKNKALPFLYDLKNKNISFNDSCVLTLLKIMSTANDTNIISRGSIEALEYVKKKSKDILDMPLENQISTVFDFDKDLIEKNLSPGGSADLLAATLMLYFLNKSQI